MQSSQYFILAKSRADLEKKNSGSAEPNANKIPVVSSFGKQRKLTTKMSPQELVQYAKERKPEIFYVSTANDKLEFDQSKPFIYYALGCHGSGGQNQFEVAQSLNDYIKEDPAKRKPMVIFLLGDNTYPEGPTRPNAKRLKKCFVDIYLKFEYLKDAKYIVIPGNHDQGHHNAHLPTRPTGIDLLANEIAYTFLDKDPSEFIKTIEDPNLGNINIISYSEMPAWTMLSSGGDVFVFGNVYFFAGNSDTFVGDFYNFFTVNETNQVKLLIEADKLAFASNGTLISLMHHPAVSPDKRAYNNDLNMYYKDKTQRELILKFLRLKLDRRYSNNKAIDRCFEMLNIEIHMFNTAHHHANYYYNDRHVSNDSQKVLEDFFLIEEQPKSSTISHIETMPFSAVQEEDKFVVLKEEEVKKHAEVDDMSEKKQKQPNYYRVIFCLGGGGSDELQERLEFGSQSKMGGYWKKFGFGAFIVSQTNPGDIQAYIVTHDKGMVNREVHYFKTTQLKAIQVHSATRSDEIKNINKFCRITKAAIDEYFRFLHQRQKEDPNKQNSGGKFFSLHPMYGNTSHGTQGVDHAHIIWNLITRMKIPSFIELVNQVYHILDRHTEPHTNSLITILNRRLEKLDTKPSIKKDEVDSIEENTNEFISISETDEAGFGMNLQNLWNFYCNPVKPTPPPNGQKSINIFQ